MFTQTVIIVWIVGRYLTARFEKNVVHNLKVELGLPIDPTWPPTRSTCGIIGLTYPKSGSVFLGYYRFVLGGCHVTPFDSNGFSWFKEVTKPIDERCLWLGAFNQVEFPSMDWSFPVFIPERGCAWKVLHTVRDPITMIISGYRYLSQIHAKGYGYLEHWAHIPSKCWSCSNASHTAIFAPCNFNCTFMEARNRVNIRESILVQALSQESALQNMISNMERWANNSQVLHISVDTMRRDQSTTWKCIQRFLGAENVTIWALMVQPIFPHHVRVNTMLHTTTDQYNNTELRAALTDHPTFGNMFAKTKALASIISRRQYLQYGCLDLM